MASRITPYTQPAEAPIMDTYVPIPFQEMMQAGAITQARYDETLAKEEEFNLDLSQLHGSSRLEIPGQPGKYIKMHDSNVIEGIRNEYLKELEDLTASIPDKSDPAHRAKLAGLYSKYKRDNSPSGRIGIAMGNIEKIKAFNKLKQDNPQLMDDPSLYEPFTQKVLAHAKATQDGSIAPLDLEGTVGNYVDVNKKLADNLKNLSPEAFGNMGIEATGIDGVYRALSSEGVSADRIIDVTQGLIKGDPQLYNTMARQARSKKMAGDKRSVQEIMAADVMSRMSTMSGLFGESKIKDKIIKDPLAVSAAKKKAKDDLETMTFNTIDFKKGTQIPNTKALGEAKDSGNALVQQAQNDLKLYATENGLQMDDQGNITSMISADGYDVSDVISKKLDSVRQAESQRNNVINLENRLMEEAGFDQTKYTRSPEWSNYLKEAEAALFNIVNPQTGDQSAIELTPEERANNATKINDTALAIAADNDPAYKRYEDLLEQNAEDGSFVAGTTSLPSDVSNTMSDWFVNNFQNLDTSIGGVTSTKTGMVYGSDEFEDVHIGSDTKTKPTFAGFSFDDKGDPLLIFGLKDEDGKSVDRVKVSAPPSFVDKLVATGRIKEAKMIINKQVSSDLGAFGIYNNEQSIDGATYLSSDLSGKHGANAPKIKLVTKGNKLAGGIGLLIDGKVTPVTDKLDAINKIENVIAAYYKKAVDAESKNK